MPGMTSATVLPTTRPGTSSIGAPVVLPPPPQATTTQQLPSNVVPVTGSAAAPTAAGAPSPAFDFQAALQALKATQPAAAAATPAAAGAASSLTSTATAAPNPLQAQALADIKTKLGAVDPFQAESIQNVRNRMSADTTKRAINVADSGIQDSLAGAMQRMRENAARAGTGGNVAPQTDALEQGAQRASAGAAANIALGRERDLDALALGSNAALQAPSQRETSLLGMQSGEANAIAGDQQSSLSQALETWRAQQNVELAKQAQQAQQSQAATANVMNLFNTLWR